MKLGRAVIAFWFLTLAYVGLLLWVDHEKGGFSGLAQLYAAFPTLAALALLAFAFRYTRWHWLLARAGFQVRPVTGFLAYLTGFAFTATPGKVGELVRIRYLQAVGVPADKVIAAFIFERTLDLLVVLGLASLAALHFDIFPFVAGFVLVVVSVVLLLVKYPGGIDPVLAVLHRRQFIRMARLVETVRQGITQALSWMSPLDLGVSFGFGLLAWGLTALAFVLLLGVLSVDLPLPVSMSLYPTAMLAGAASMLPGGVGSTEGVLVLMLTGLEVPFGLAAIAAIGIRLATLWFAILLGLFAMLVLEVRLRRTSPVNLVDTE